MLDLISCHLVNMHRKKGTKPVKVGEQFQPDYVKEAKKEIKASKKESAKEAQEDLAKIFEKRNSKVKKLEEEANRAQS